MSLHTRTGRGAMRGYITLPEGTAVGDDVSTLAIHYNYPYSPSQKGNSEENLADAHAHIDATVAQCFYTSNLFHDLTYRYGFTEEAGNFQQYNFGRGSEESGAVITNAQDGSGFNNANFMTPPDGQNGKCRMYLWNTANPYRDGDMEAGIVIHELTHGLSTRLTGGSLLGPPPLIRTKEPELVDKLGLDAITFLRFTRMT